MSKLSRQIRNLVFVLVVVILSFACTIELLQIQIVDGEYYKDQTANTYTANQTVQAARGQIFTKDGKVVNTNRLVYKIIVQKAFFKSGTENDVIAKTLKILQNNDQKWIDTLPVSKTTPYQFTGDDDEIDTLRSKLELGVYATAENCMNALYEKFEISDSYGQEMRRYIAGVRYEMLIRDFSYQNRYTLAEDVSVQTVIELKEQSFMLGGIDIIEEAIRQYDGKDFIPQVVGRICRIVR